MTRDLIGQQLGNYRLVSLLGRGGFAEVYLGQHVRLSMQAAIKVLHAHLSDEQIQGFQQEAETIAKLVHPHIVRILDFDVFNGIPFLVMDYCPHGTLRQRHPKGERVPLLTVVSYVQQVADALQYAHNHKLIHRDVKPENMLIGQRNDILLSDFGIASTAHNTSSMSTQVPAGTIPYMAPEQIQAQARPASDQYALGVVAYEWLCGVRPFEGSHTEIFAKHLMTPPPPLLPKVPTLPPDVEQVVLTALTKDHHQRFATIQAFATALQQASQAKPSPPLPTQLKTTPPHPIPAPVPIVLGMPMPSDQTPPLNQLPTLLSNVSPSLPLETPQHLSPQPASSQVPKDRRGIATPYHPPTELKQSKRSRLRGRVPIGLTILTAIAIIIASTVIFQPLSSTLTHLFSSTHTGIGNLHTSGTTTNSGSIYTYFDDFSSYTPGQPPRGWLLRGASAVTPTIEEVGGSGPAYRLLNFPEVPWQYWDRWALKDGLIVTAPYIITVKLNFQNSVADRAGLTIAWNDAKSDRIDIQPNVYGNDIEFRVTYTGSIQSNVVVTGPASQGGGLPINANTDYWLRVSATSTGPGNGQIIVYWSTDGMNFTAVETATGIADLTGLVGVGTAGPHLPHTYFDDFQVKIGVT